MRKDIQERKVKELFDVIEELDLNRAELSRAAGYEASTLSTLANAQRLPPPRRVSIIAQSLRDYAIKLQSQELQPKQPLDLTPYLKNAYIAEKLGVTRQDLCTRGIPTSRIPEIEKLLKKISEKLLKATNFVI